MERDFMGLSLEGPLAMVKEEILNDAGQQSGYGGSGVPWSFSIKKSGVANLKRQEITRNHSSNKHMIGGIPVLAPQSIYSQTLAQPWNIPKSAGSPPLTIFYAGSVNVYNDISPEKVQAIMFMAANGVSPLKPQVTGPGSKMVASDIITPLNQSIYQQHCSGLSSPLSLSSHNGAQSGSGSTSTDELIVAKTSGAPTTPMSKAEPPTRVVNAIGSASPMLSYAVPQSRKASLARFLEKRKERVMNAAPYNLLKKPENSGSAEFPLKDEVAGKTTEE